jgi:hypothetical protein
MTSFGWDVLTLGLAAGLGLGLTAVTALRLRTTRRRAQLAHVGSATKRRRIDVWQSTKPLALPGARTKRVTRDGGFLRLAKGGDKQ